MIDNFKLIGFNTHQSKILSILIDEKWHTAKELESKLGLRQPEVSNGLFSIWAYIEYDSIKQERGAPLKPIRLAMSKVMFLENLRNIALEEFNAKCDAIKELGDFTALHEEDD